jgi:Terminase small subunit
MSEQTQERFDLPMPTRLPQRKELFAHHVAAFVAPDVAYMRAGYKGAKFARANAARLLREPDVVARIEELRATFRERCALDLERLQALLMPIVEANFLDFFEPRGQPVNGKRCKRKGGDKPAADAATSFQFKPLDRLRYEQGLAVAGVKFNDAGEVVDLKLHGKTEAARVLLATLGVSGGEGELSLLDLGARLGQALERAKSGGKVIDGEVVDRKPMVPAVAPAKFDW